MEEILGTGARIDESNLEDKRPFISWRALPSSMNKHWELLRPLPWRTPRHSKRCCAKHQLTSISEKLGQSSQ
ncbi:hypothetical protein V6N11_008447 [Hibiscus sabdariffa]|uniref:Uncharacterized protein n=2 Tax=Hibiscus sabdariffa TaxID=183260 RepID=A0ABR2CAN9_9ROSI